jgi:hypothetical protein
MMGIIINTLIALVIFNLGYFFGRQSVKYMLVDRVFREIQEKAAIPVCVAECVEKNYYLFEKDTDKFLCQAPSLDELPQSLFESKKIKLALVLFPTETHNENFWIINGKIKKLTQ